MELQGAYTEELAYVGTRTRVFQRTDAPYAVHASQMSLHLRPVAAAALSAAAAPANARMAFEFAVARDKGLRSLMLVTGTGSDPDGHCKVAGWYNPGNGRCAAFSDAHGCDLASTMPAGS